MEVDGQRHAPTSLPLGKRPGTHGIGVWVGPWDDMGYCGNSPPPHTRIRFPELTS